MPSNLIPGIALEQAVIHNPLIVSSDISITEAIAWMNSAQATCTLEENATEDGEFLQAKCCTSCLLVVDKAHLVGILTNQDVVRLSANGQLLSDRSLAEVMTRPVVTLQQSKFTDICAALQLCQKHHIHHLPLVSDRGQIIGLLTQDTLFQALQPVESYKLMTVLEQKVSHLESEKTALLNKFVIAMLRVFAARVDAELDRQASINALKELNEELEDRIAQRTIALQQSEEQFRQIFQQSPIGIAISDLKGQLTRVNSSLLNITGCSQSELLQRSLQDIFVADGQQQRVEQLAQLLEQPLSVMTFESQLISQRGETVWVNVTSALMLDSFGQPAAVVHLIEDVSDRKETEAILTNYAREVEDLYNNAPCGYHSLDAEGCFASINDTELQWFGYSRAEMLGKPATDFMTEASRQVFQTRYLEFQQCGYAKDLEYEMLCKDGKVFPILLNATAVRSADGTYLYSRSTSLDIRDRKATEEVAKRQLMAIEAVVDGLAIVEGETFTYLNKSHLELFGYSDPSELVGKSWRLLYSPEELSRFEREVFPTLTEQRYWQGEAIATRKDGSTFHEGLSLTLTDGGALICVCRDVTERKQVEVKTQQANDQLLLANAELARATRLKDEFLANMSHELRTPLNAILGMTEGLQEEVFGVISDRQKKAIITIERSGKHLLELINDILDLSKIESGKLELEITPVAVSYLCESSLTFVRQQALKKNIQLTAQVPPGLPTMTVDERRLRQVLINLLNNAVKFTPEGGQVKLVVHLERQPTHTDLCFSVIDTGVGVDPENKEKLFQPFVQIDSSLNRQHSGTGLGLALVQQLVELHQGTVTVTSDVGKGSCFTVRLPQALSTNPAEMLSLHNRDSLIADELQVLVIGDSMVAAEQISQYLEGYGMRSVIYPYGEGAAEEAGKICPGLIILNIQLPHLSGWEVLNQLKSYPLTQQIPVLVISVESERSQGLALGGAEYLVEPFSRSQLHQAIEQLWKLQRNSQDILSIAPTSKISPLVLLAENNEASIATISSYLGSRGYRLVMAKNSQECMNQALVHHPDLILIDVQIPSMDGLKTIQKIRTYQPLQNTPILVLTALAMPSDREKCIAAGADEYLTKPVKLKQLLGVIQQLLEKD